MPIHCISNALPSIPHYQNHNVNKTSFGFLFQLQSFWQRCISFAVIKHAKSNFQQNSRGTNIRESKAILKKANQRLARYLMTHQWICTLAQQLAAKQPQNTNRRFWNIWSRVLKSISIEQQLKKIELVIIHSQKNQTDRHIQSFQW